MFSQAKKLNGPLVAALPLSALLGLSVLGCAPAKTQSVPTPMMTPHADVPPPAEQNPGSLFNPGTAELLFADNRARRVGDIVLVNIVEQQGHHRYVPGFQRGGGH